jgi:hypothetical protein
MGIVKKSLINVVTSVVVVIIQMLLESRELLSI